MITLTVNAQDGAHLASLLAGLVNPAALVSPHAESDSGEAPPVEKKPARSAPKKAEGAKEPAAEVAPTEPAESAATPAKTEVDTGAEAPQHTVSYAEFQKISLELVKMRGRDALIGLLSEFGVDHGSKLAPKQWPSAYSRAAALLAESAAQ